MIQILRINDWNLGNIYNNMELVLLYKAIKHYSVVLIPICEPSIIVAYFNLNINKLNRN